MILSVLRCGAGQGVKLVRPLISLQQNATMMGKAMRGYPIERPPPYPYQKKPYYWINSVFDTTLWRFDENSKIIVVDGPIASGKTEFAKALAEEFELLHLPEITMDKYYINDYGYDLRQLDPQLPESCQSCDVQRFLREPKNIQTAFFQLSMYTLRYEQYLEALAHILNTGQGVVLERSPYSDFVFLEAMVKAGYISKEARKYYYTRKENSIPELLQPHMIIYLDVDVPTIQKRIKQRNLKYEVNSPVLTTSYLQSIEQSYKEKYLKEASVHTELLVYNWNEPGSIEEVVEDIERIDFEKFDEDKLNPKMSDWKFKVEGHLTVKRIEYTSNRHLMLDNMDMPSVDVPELQVSGDDWSVYDKVRSKAPGMKYSKGYNEDQGDKNILFK